MGRTIPGTPYLFHSSQNQGAERLNPSHQAEKDTQDSMEGYSDATRKVTFFTVLLVSLIKEPEQWEHNTYVKLTQAE